jgi:hypothetical protein
LFIGANSLMQYRSWDLVPDVMIFTRRRPAGFPNGRFLTDDVVKLLAQDGDTLLYELSFVPREEVTEFKAPHDLWKRKESNDKDFIEEFPYLAEPWQPWRPQRPPPMLTAASKWKLAAIAFSVVFVLLVAAWVGAYVYARRQRRRRYL